ncbi:Fpg/Nei family DNA glycosylase [Paracidobacterium acidisoli]|uniref:DNA-(apurinic or apyrimidinic site) lyase n=1 Tax=Paracidobacterium acidisoli TaxID=2303751 RepID=A0A372IPN6_9BACT|nr:DNA-formamidopyrimidine glycosylase family protein [Paracidobacterium acidisoli]MBT9330998.1 Fpg/Nei family DNA glycosylase [Paracidobacterium acidisoli]
MPEGNEIHRFADRHAAAFAGKRVQVDSPNGAFPDAALLYGRKLQAVEAYGKHLGYFFGRDLILHIHLGMYGDFRDGRMPMPEEKGALRLRMWTTRDWMELRGAMDCSLFDEKKWQKLMARIGPDPLRPGSDPEPAFAWIKERTAPVGLLLMDQSIFGGIGNIFRAELLFRAKINPWRPGGQTETTALRGIWKEAKTLMREAMVDRRIVTTRSKHRPHKRGPAEDHEVHYAYRRAGKPCFVCGATIKKADMGGRTVYWCPECQKD